MPEDLAERLIPLALCTSETAAKIRLSLFAMLEAQRLSDVEKAAWNNHPLYGTLWLLLCADFYKTYNAQNMLLMLLSPEMQPAAEAIVDPRFPDAQEQIPLLRESLLERVKEHLPFYTAQELGDILKQLLHLEGTVSPELLKPLMELALPYVETAVTQLLPDNAKPVEKPGLVKRGLQFMATPLINRGVQEIPNLMKQAPHLVPGLLRHSPMGEQEQIALRGFFAQANPPQEQFAFDGVPALSTETLKSHFWDYYRILYADCMSYDGICNQDNARTAKNLRLPLLLLQQEIAHDPEAAILVRILTLLSKCAQDQQGQHLHRLGQFQPDRLCKVLRDEGADALVARFKQLINVPSQIERDDALRRCNGAAQFALDVQEVASCARELGGYVKNAAASVFLAPSNLLMGAIGRLMPAVPAMPAMLEIEIPQDQEQIQEQVQAQVQVHAQAQVQEQAQAQEQVRAQGIRVEEEHIEEIRDDADDVQRDDAQQEPVASATSILRQAAAGAVSLLMAPSNLLAAALPQFPQGENAVAVVEEGARGIERRSEGPVVIDDVD